MKKGFFWGSLVSLIIMGILVAGCSKGGSTSARPQPAQSQAAAPVLDEWPSKMPADVPMFSYGKITGYKIFIHAIVVNVEKATPDFFDKYQSDLKNAGWTITAASQTKETIIIQATKGQSTVEANFSNGTGGLHGSVTFKHAYPEWS